MLKVNYLVNRGNFLTGIKSLINKIKLFFAFLKVKKYMDWSAEKVTNFFFNDQKLKAVFLGILADMVVKPSEFFGLGVPLFNIETAFDKRIPLEFDGGKYPSYHYVMNGCESLVKALANNITEKGGKILTNKKVTKILIENNRAVGIKLNDGKILKADYVFASGGIQNTFHKLVGKKHLTKALKNLIENIKYMESVLMVHIGTDLDPSKYQPEALCYYYRTYDIEESIERIRIGDYHEGKEGFLIYIPSMHSPNMAPPGKYAITIYTIAPHKLKNGSWKDKKEELASKLIIEAESIIPKLKDHILVKKILTPEDFKKRINVLRHSFGGTAPTMDQQNPPHKTPIKGLWFIGAYSESGGGVEGVMTGTRNAIKRFLKEKR
jgi:phytoene dehydrogenase-like protein